MTPRHPLDPVLAPSSVMVVGASSDPRKRGYQVLAALEEAGYAGELYPVNPRGGEILGHAVHTSVEGVPGTPELALVCTPAETAPEVVAACGRKGVRGAVILAVGFRESGASGAELERRVLEAAREGGVRLVGPNTSGILNLPQGLNLIGARAVRSGSLSLLVQSGNMALALMNEVTRRSSDGIALAIGVGNQTDLGFAEYLDYLGQEDNTRAVVTYVEGFRNARAFLGQAAEVGRSRPVVVLKGGRSDSGREAARSHTGSVAGQYARLQAGFRQAGVVEVTRTDELLHVAETLAHQPPMAPGSGVAILSDGGGQGTLAADTLEEMGVSLARIGEGTRDRLRALLGPAASLNNPVDLAGAADAEPRVFDRALSELASDPAVGCVLLVGLFGGYGIRFAEEFRASEEEAAGAMAGAMREAGKPWVVHSMYADHRSSPLLRLGGERVPVVGSLEVACRCVAAIRRRGLWLAERPWHPGGEQEIAPGLAAEVARVVEAAASQRRTTLTEPESRALLNAAGARVPPSVVCPDEASLRDAVRSMQGPVALKVVSPAISHKTEAGGVALHLGSADEAVEAFHRIMEDARAWLAARASRGDGQEDRGIQGVLVTPMLPPPLAELLVGASRDPDVGPVLTVGGGGMWVELLGDVAHRVLPVDDDGIRGMLEELKIHPLLSGARGRPAANLDALVQEVQAVARCLLAGPRISEVEVNPLRVYPDGALVTDARVFLQEDG